MMVPDLSGLNERQSFFDGQRLFASDLEEIEAFNRRMRWLHNMSLHQPGIGLGLAVTGNKGDRGVTVQPGYAIDAAGREIVLVEAHVEPVPPVAAGAGGKPATYDLTIAYPEDDDLEEVEFREGLCLQRGAIRLAEAPVFCWVPADPADPLAGQVKAGMRLVLARVAVADCKLDADVDLDLAQRRSARPATRPYLAAGIEDAPSWSTSDRINGIKAHIDTSGGRFTVAPEYQARIEGMRPHPTESTIDGPIHVTDSDHEGFTIHVALLNPDGSVPATIHPRNYHVAGNVKGSWRVTWLGVER
jgi:hypothetical protein